MVMHGETIQHGAPDTCPDCKVKLVPKVYETCAFYVGTWCNCGPYSRESGYYRTREEAETALNSGVYGR